MRSKDKEVLMCLALAMLNRSKVRYVKEGYNAPYLIQNINIDGMIDLYSVTYNDVIYSSVSFKDVKII